MRFSFFFVRYRTPSLLPLLGGVLHWMTFRRILRRFCARGGPPDIGATKRIIRITSKDFLIVAPPLGLPPNRGVRCFSPQFINRWGGLPGHSPGAFACRWKSGGSAPTVREGYPVSFVPKMYRPSSPATCGSTVRDQRSVSV